MANYAYFYTIGFFDGAGNGIDRDVISFFEKLERVLIQNDPRIIRQMNGDVFRVFSYCRDTLNDEILVIPFGKLIRKNKPYASDDQDPKTLVELKAKMYDVNCLVYSKRHHLAMYTTNHRGATHQEFCQYLNSYLFKQDDCDLKMSPIFFSKTLEDLRNSERVTSMTVSVDLGDSINNYFNGQITGRETGLIGTFRNMMNASKDDADGKYLMFRIGIGHGKKTEKLDKDSILSLLGQLNLDSRFFKEIELTYEDQRTEKVETLKIKNKDAFLRGKFSTADSKLAPDFLLANSSEVFLKEREYFLDDVRKMIEGTKKDKNEDYELQLDWREDE